MLEAKVFAVRRQRAAVPGLPTSDQTADKLVCFLFTVKDSEQSTEAFHLEYLTPAV